MIVTFTEAIPEVQQQAGQSLTRCFERESIEMVHVDADFVTEELDQLDRQLRISPVDDCEIAFLIDDGDLRGFQCFARDFMKCVITEYVFRSTRQGPKMRTICRRPRVDERVSLTLPAHNK